MIRIDAMWLAADPIDMRASAERLLARVVQVLGAAQAHHGQPPPLLRVVQIVGYAISRSIDATLALAECGRRAFMESAHAFRLSWAQCVLVPPLATANCDGRLAKMTPFFLQEADTA
ncbi:hypothetical protein [Variovorax sp. E3]|uniref:hypothetical protein n=1 Tax=Variovorax sp. E3 TaxID=1914993 RepID=UPI0018DBF86F|nr:hypothetical protein [Variovorax sp. E3]